jgi:acetyl-CoA carboxylase carboxyltransferase component
MDGRVSMEATVTLGEEELRKRVLAGGAERYHDANAARGKLFARERIARLVDDGSFVEDGLFANVLADGLPADGWSPGRPRSTAGRCA